MRIIASNLHVRVGVGALSPTCSSSNLSLLAAGTSPHPNMVRPAQSAIQHANKLAFRPGIADDVGVGRTAHGPQRRELPLHLATGAGREDLVAPSAISFPQIGGRCAPDQREKRERAGEQHFFPFGRNV